MLLRFEDGSECLVTSADPDRLIPAQDSSLFPDEEQCPYFPGLVVHASGSVLRAAKYTRGSFRSGRGTSVVARVSPGEITVDWLAGAGRDGHGEPPPATMPATALWPLTFYGHTCWQLGDHAIVDDTAPVDGYASTEPIYPLDGMYDNGEDPACVAREFAEAAVSAGIAAHVAEITGAGAVASVNTGTAAAFAFAEAERAHGGGGGVGGLVSRGAAALFRRNVSTGIDAGRTSDDTPPPMAPRVADLGPKPIPVRPAAVIIGTHTRVDVHWQDGRITRRVHARELVPITHLGEHDFWPEQFVIKAVEEDPFGPVGAEAGSGSDGGGGGSGDNTAAIIDAWLGGGDGGVGSALPQPGVIRPPVTPEVDPKP